MKIEVLGNANYCASIVAIENIIPLTGCDNIVGTIIQGNHVIVSKDIKVGDIGIFFPIETAIKAVFLNANNLFRESSYNVDPTKTGFFELNGRVRCMKLRGFRSEGFYMPLDSLKAFGSFQDIKDLGLKKIAGASLDFDHIDGEKICEKYFITKNVQGSNANKADKKLKRISKLVEGQFHFHIDTAHLAKNIHRIEPDSLISITEKVHGTSAIVSKILCNKELTWKDRIAKRLGVKIADKDYDLIWASRKVVKNQYVEKKNHEHFYSEDIWKVGADELAPFLEKGMTIYYEIVGFTSDGAAIQGKAPKIFDYGCGPKKHKNIIYRVTSTNADGRVFEYSARQVQQFCARNGLTAVPEHFYGRASNLFPVEDLSKFYMNREDRLKVWQEHFLTFLEKNFLEKKCVICNNDVPNEGIVLRLETLDIDPFKFKSNLFRMLETKMLDENLVNIEDNPEFFE